nr:hypothetical protein Itr_chr08CG11120 [Ipomoea trifida]
MQRSPERNIGSDLLAAAFFTTRSSRLAVEVRRATTYAPGRDETRRAPEVRRGSSPLPLRSSKQRSGDLL